MHNAVKTVGIAGVNDLHVLTYDPTDDRGICESQQRDDKHVIAQLVGNLTRSRPSEQKISHYQAIKGM